MSDDNVLDQNEIERLLGGGGGAKGAPPPSEPATPAASSEESAILAQSELDALFSGGNAGSAAAASAPAVSSSGPLGQAELDALLGGASSVSSAASDSQAPSNGPLGQSELDALFAGGNSAPAAAKPQPTPSPPPKPAAPPTVPPVASFAAAPPFGGGAASVVEDFDEDDGEGVPRGDLNYIMKRADDSLRSIASSKLDLPTEVIEFQFPEFGGTVPSTEHATLDQISEVELDVKIELGRTDMYLEDVLKLRKGSVVPLDKMAGDAVDIYVNGRLLARGEVLVMNENFCVRVAELLAGAIPME